MSKWEIQTACCRRARTSLSPVTSPAEVERRGSLGWELLLV